MARGTVWPLRAAQQSSHRSGCGCCALLFIAIQLCDVDGSSKGCKDADDSGAAVSIGEDCGIEPRCPHNPYTWWLSDTVWVCDDDL